MDVYSGKYDGSAFDGSDTVAVIDTLAGGYEMIVAAMQAELST